MGLFGDSEAEKPKETIHKEVLLPAGVSGTFKLDEDVQNVVHIPYGTYASLEGMQTSGFTYRTNETLRFEIPDNEDKNYSVRLEHALEREPFLKELVLVDILRLPSHEKNWHYVSLYRKNADGTEERVSSVEIDHPLYLQTDDPNKLPDTIQIKRSDGTVVRLDSIPSYKPLGILPAEQSFSISLEDKDSIKSKINVPIPEEVRQKLQNSLSEGAPDLTKAESEALSQAIKEAQAARAAATPENAR